MQTIDSASAESVLTMPCVACHVCIVHRSVSLIRVESVQCLGELLQRIPGQIWRLHFMFFFSVSSASLSVVFGSVVCSRRYPISICLKVICGPTREPFHQNMFQIKSFVTD